MANLDILFRKFDNELNITKTKKDALMRSKNNLRDKIRDHFSKNHPDYNPVFYIQGSYKLKTLIRTKYDTCDLDDGVYFKKNPDNVTSSTLQRWVKEAVDGTTEATPEHKKKCIRVDFKAGYNVDLPVFVFDEETDDHPLLAVKNVGFQIDDPREFVLEFRRVKTDQMVRMVRYLKSWCDHKWQEMPSGLSMTVLAMNHFQSNSRDDVALRFLLIEIEKDLKKAFRCVMPTTPKDDLYSGYTDTKKSNFLNNLSTFIEDATKAIAEKNKLKASNLWKKHLGDRFPDGEDEEEESSSSAKLLPIIGSSRPYFMIDK